MAETTFDKQSEGFTKNVVAYQKTVLHWYDDIVTLDAATIQARGTKIINGWEKLAASHGALANAGHNAMVAPPQEETGGARPDFNAINNDLLEAAGNLELTRKLIGNVVGLQDFNKHAVRGSYRIADTGKDPTVFVETQVDHAVQAFSIILRVGAICDRQNAAGRLTVQDQNRLVDIISETTSDLEYRFVMTALRHLKYDDVVYSIRDSQKSRMVEHHDDLEQQAATRGEVTPEVAKQMSADIDKLAKLSEEIFPSQSVVDRILDKYEEPAIAKRVFARLIERRGIADNLMARSGSERLAQFLGRTIDPNMVIGNAFVEVGDEALRQTPGAICSFMSGVYAGMSGLPVIGGTMQDASDGFKDLAKIADDATGAWKDGAKTRDKIAWWTGRVVEGIAEVAVTRQVAGAQAGQALQGAKTGFEAFELADTAAGAVATMRKLYDDASGVWKFAMDQLPSTLATVRDAVALGEDPSGVGAELLIDTSSALIDVGIKALKTKLKGSFTAEGRVAARAAKAKQPGDPDPNTVSDDKLPQQIRDAVRRLRAAQETATSGKDSTERWHGAFEAKLAAEDLKEALGRNREAVGTAQIVHEGEVEKKQRDAAALERGGDDLDAVLGDRLIEVFIAAGVGVLSKVKGAIAKHAKLAIKRGRDGNAVGIDREKLEKDIAIAAVEGAVGGVRDALVASLSDWVKDLVASAVAKLVDKKFPGTHDEVAQLAREPIGKLLEYVTTDVPADWLKEKVEAGVSSMFETKADKQPAADQVTP